MLLTEAEARLPEARSGRRRAIALVVDCSAASGRALAEALEREANAPTELRVCFVRSRTWLLRAVTAGHFAHPALSEPREEHARRWLQAVMASPSPPAGVSIAICHGGRRSTLRRLRRSGEFELVVDGTRPLAADPAGDEGGPR